MPTSDRADTKMVWICVDTLKPVGDPDHLKVFADQETANAWSAENNPPCVAFAYPVIEASGPSLVPS